MEGLSEEAVFVLKPKWSKGMNPETVWKEQCYRWEPAHVVALCGKEVGILEWRQGWGENSVVWHHLRAGLRIWVLGGEDHSYSCPAGSVCHLYSPQDKTHRFTGSGRGTTLVGICWGTPCWVLITISQDWEKSQRNLR